MLGAALGGFSNASFGDDPIYGDDPFEEVEGDDGDGDEGGGGGDEVGGGGADGFAGLSLFDGLDAHEHDGGEQNQQYAGGDVGEGGVSYGAVLVGGWAKYPDPDSGAVRAGWVMVLLVVVVPVSVAP